MKILVLAPQPFFQERGTPIAVRHLLEVLGRDGHQLDALVFHEGEDVKVEGCTIHRTRNLSWVRNVPPGFSWKKLVCDLMMLFKAISLNRNNRYDIVHAVEESVFIALILKWLHKTPYVYDMDSSLPNQLVNKLWFLRPFSPLFRLAERSAVKNSKGIVAVCNSLEDTVATYSNSTPVVRVEDISLVDIDQTETDTIKVEDWIDTRGPIVMYVGNLQSYQGIDLLLDSFVHAYHRHEDLQLVVIGGSDEEIKTYQKKAEEFEVSDRTHFLGPRPVDKLGSYLRQADILVSPRTQGTNTPMKIYSYLESGVPVLATRLEMHSQVLNDDVAVLTPPTPLELARGIDVLLKDYEFREELTANAREYVREQYSSEVIDGKLTVFYEWIEEEISGTKEASKPSLTAQL